MPRAINRPVSGSAAAPDLSAQFRTRGYVLSETSAMILKDLFAAMDAAAFAYDMDAGGSANCDLTGDQVAALLRSFARLGNHAIADAPFANEVMARPAQH